jgi:hypothetical protein
LQVPMAHFFSTPRRLSDQPMRAWTEQGTRCCQCGRSTRVTAFLLLIWCSSLITLL